MFGDCVLALNCPLLSPPTLRLVIISFRPAWLARDTALASSVHSLQEMTDADEGRKTPLDAQGGLLSVISPVSFLSLALVKNRCSWYE